jgi:hypothetical protein
MSSEFYFQFGNDFKTFSLVNTWVEECLSTATTMRVCLFVYEGSLGQQYLGRHCQLFVNYRACLREFHGYISEIKPLKQVGYYEIVAHSLCYMLSEKIYSRTFSDCVVTDVIRLILQRYAKVKWSIERLIYPPGWVNFIAQYDETDYHFLQRITAHYGIFFYEQDGVLYFSDSLSGCSNKHLPIGFSQWQVCYQLIPSQLSLLGETSLSTQLAKQDNITDWHVYEGWSQTPSYQQNRLTVLSRYFRQQLSQIYFRSDHLHLQVGDVLYKTESYLPHWIWHSFIIVDGELQYDQQGAAYHLDFPAQAKPISSPGMQDLQKVRVVAVETDVHCRVRILFPWDTRQSQSAWVSVRQSWCGQGYGAQFIPQSGDEVWVGFECGDISRPLVLGPDVLPSHTLRIGYAAAYLDFLKSKIVFHSDGLFALNAVSAIDWKVNGGVIIRCEGKSQQLIIAPSICMEAEQVIRFEVGESFMELSGEEVIFSSEEIHLCTDNH